jgi:hypothetical protein
MRKPDQICPVCQLLPSHSSLGDVCSDKCAERLSETHYYELELSEAVAELNDFEEGVYLPLYLKLVRADARLRVLQVGMSALTWSTRNTDTLNEPLEVREWKEAQQKQDTWALSLVQRPLRRLQKKVRQLETELREIDQHWQSLSGRKEATLDRLSKARGE